MKLQTNGLFLTHKKQLSESDICQLMNLWNHEYPQNLAYNHIEELNRYIDSLLNCDHYLLIMDEAIAAWAFTFDRNDEKWFVIILSNAIQGKGLGTQLLDKIKDNESEINGWVIDHNRDLKTNGKRYRSPLRFYTKNGFKVLLNQRLELDTLSAVKIHWKRAPTF